MDEGIYIYCIVRSGESMQFDAMGVGERGDRVYAICFQDIGAVVSNSPIRKYSVAREHLMAHEQAIEEVMKTHTVLPVRFATMTENENKVKAMLEREYHRFLALLAQMEDKKELGLKILFRENAIYPEILAKYKEIQLLKEKVASTPPEKSHYQRMEIGKMVEAALQREKEFYRERTLSRLTPLSVQVKSNRNYGDLMIMNAAFLVAEEKEGEFDAAVQELADEYGEIVRLKYVGTMPPFNFVNLVINMEGG